MSVDQIMKVIYLNLGRIKKMHLQNWANNYHDKTRSPDEIAQPKGKVFGKFILY